MHLPGPCSQAKGKINFFPPDAGLGEMGTARQAEAGGELSLIVHLRRRLSLFGSPVNFNRTLQQRARSLGLPGRGGSSTRGSCRVVGLGDLGTEGSDGGCLCTILQSHDTPYPCLRVDG